MFLSGAWQINKNPDNVISLNNEFMMKILLKQAPLMPACRPAPYEKPLSISSTA
jgi:hypothetical protein